SGTFVNRARLSPPNQESKPHLLHHGDVIQLGVDYQGGIEEIYRCVKMRIEINQTPTSQTGSSYCLNSFKTLRNLAAVADEVDECCICLYAIAPFQALFVAPCSHTFHFKCSYPLLNNYPGFTCPLCRSYADLNANVAIDTEDVIQMLRSQPSSSSSPPTTRDFPTTTLIKVDNLHVQRK
ncbi:uncharacterized protein EV154DRAFT_516851, partial [Mucor mucedo]|uniref:uncharacterized protein n=1 Tax=Mucor mucedo TaxID=29922 RepID=UPI00221FB705